MDFSIVFFIISLILFSMWAYLSKYIIKYIRKNSHIRILNLEEYLPVEEIQTLKQVSYLIMMTLFIIDIFYQLTFQGNDILFFICYDIILSLISLSLIRTENIKSYLVLFGLMPFVSFDYLFLNSNNILLVLMLIIHFVTLVYLIFYFYDKFKRYTKSNGLSYSILLLFGIVFVSFIWTSFVEDVNLLDSLVMVSNAFTSNGYAILGHTIPGKINELFLVWSGYVLSGVGTATLTIALINKYYYKKFDELQQSIEELKELIKQLEEENK